MNLVPQMHMFIDASQEHVYFMLSAHNAALLTKKSPVNALLSKISFIIQMSCLKKKLIMSVFVI